MSRQWEQQKYARLKKSPQRVGSEKDENANSFENFFSLSSQRERKKYARFEKSSQGVGSEKGKNITIFQNFFKKFFISPQWVAVENC